MHPEIKRFWGNRLIKILGTIYATDRSPEQSVTTWFVLDPAFTAYEYKTETKYYYNRKPCSEEEILRIIKLKAFI